jgi:hypothetical protein
MADIVVDTQDLIVFGGPSELNVQLDFGATGLRGSNIYAGEGAAEDTLSGVEVQQYDLYIDIGTSSPDYGWMYQYILSIGGTLVWTKILYVRGSFNYKSTPPAHYNSTGTLGQIATDSSYMYVCIATNTWVRSSITTSF